MTPYFRSSHTSVWKGSLAQYAGRIHRQAEGKDKVIIYDYVNNSLLMLQRMSYIGKKAMTYLLTLLQTLRKVV